MIKLSYFFAATAFLAVTACSSSDPIATPLGTAGKSAAAGSGTSVAGQSAAAGAPAAQAGSTATTAGKSATGGVAQGTAGSGTAGAAPVSGEMKIGDGGYVTSGTWKGYSWTSAVTGTGTGAATTTIDPADFKTVKATATQLCAKGAVGKDPAYGGVGMVGINLNQEVLPPTGSTEPPILDYTPTGTGITFNVTNTAATDLRIQIQDKSGTAAGRWCASISGKTTGTVTWADFNTTCWSPATGKAYNKEPLKDISIMVPGKDTADVPFEFCINSLSEAK